MAPRALPWVIAAVAAAVLATAHILEAFGWIPCELCLEQRIPYWIGSGIALAAAIAALPRLNLGLISSLLMAAAAITFVVGAGLAIQHIGVEQHWWKSTCSGGGKASIADLLASVGKRPIVPCDEKRPFLFGLTLTNYNLLISIALAALAASIPLRQLKGRAK
ncbi:MAG: disulfide bond formation protein B [Alphaproteobacteria bacterium]